MISLIITLPLVAASAGLMIGSMALSAIGTAMSFVQAGKQKRLASKAASEAEIAINNARAIATRNVAEQGQIPLQAYEQGFRQRQVLQKDIMNSLQSADARSLAAGVGNVAQSGQQASQQQQASVEQAIFDREATVLEGEEAKQKRLYDLEIAQGKGAMQAAAQASNAQTRAIAGGAKTLTAGLKAAYENEDINALYGKSLGNKLDGYSGAVERYTQAAIDNGKILEGQRDSFMAHLAKDASEGGANVENNAAMRGFLADEDFSLVDGFQDLILDPSIFTDGTGTIDTSAPQINYDFNSVSPGVGGMPTQSALG